MKPHTSYVICAVQRSGSFLLCEALKNTGMAGKPGEHFLCLNGEDWENGWWARQHGVTTRADYLRLVFEKGTTPNGVFGTKIIWSYFHKMLKRLQELPDYEGMRAPELMASLFPNLHYIWIIRRDTVRQAVSWAKAAQTDIYVWLQGETPVPKQEPIFDFRLIDYLHRVVLEGEKGWQSFFEECGIEPFKVEYEELVEAYERTAISILEYLTVPYPEDLEFGEKRLQKQADAVNEAWVQRYLTVARNLQNSSEMLYNQLFREG